MQPTLLVLAAGMGSRYGGLKQLDAFGPSGETIIDYSVFDACRAGFGKVVFVIREEFEKEFKEKISDKYKSKIAVELVYQSLSNIPSGYLLSEERVKPLGTGHAVWCAKDVIGEQFAVINADDFYGPSSFSLICDYLKELDDKNIAKQTMVGYKLTNTLSENGHVSRGVCELCPETQKLKSITERTQICHTDHGVVFVENEVEHKLSGEEVVSMNMMGFTSVAMEHFDKDLREFLDENQKDLKKEFYLPTVLNNLIQRGHSCVKVLETSEKWFGVTYPEDKPTVVVAISKLHSTGSYPQKLW